MWKSIMANQRYNQGYSYISRTRTKASGGKTVMSDGTTYQNVPISFEPEKLGPKWSGDGYQINSYAKAIIPERYFSKYEFSPSLDDMIVGKNNQRFRVINIEDYSDQPHMGIYIFVLKRVEYD